MLFGHNVYFDSPTLIQEPRENKCIVSNYTAPFLLNNVFDFNHTRSQRC